MPDAKPSARRNSPQVQSLTTALAHRAVWGSVNDHLQQWTAVLGLTEDDPPGISLCADDPLPPASARNLGPVQLADGTLTFPTTSVRGTLIELATYARSVRQIPISNPKAFGSGILVQTRYRLSTPNTFERPAHQLLEVTCEAYATCLRAALREEVCARLNATDLEAAYFEVLAGKLGLSADQKLEFHRLKTQHPDVSDPFRFTIVINQRGLPDDSKQTALRLRAAYPAMTDDLCLDIAAGKIAFSDEEYRRLSAEYQTASPERKWEIFRESRARGWGEPYKS